MPRNKGGCLAIRRMDPRKLFLKTSQNSFWVKPCATTTGLGSPAQVHAWILILECSLMSQDTRLITEIVSTLPPTRTFKTSLTYIDSYLYQFFPIPILTHTNSYPYGFFPIPILIHNNSYPYGFLPILIRIYTDSYLFRFSPIPILTYTNSYP